MAEKKKSAPVSSGPVKPEDKKKALETALCPHICGFFCGCFYIFFCYMNNFCLHFVMVLLLYFRINIIIISFHSQGILIFPDILLLLLTFDMLVLQEALLPPNCLKSHTHISQEALANGQADNILRLALLFLYFHLQLQDQKLPVYLQQAFFLLLNPYNKTPVVL